MFSSQKGEGFVMWSDSFFHNSMEHVWTAIFAATAVLLYKVALSVGVMYGLFTHIHTEHSYIYRFLLYDFLYYIHLAGLNS